MVFPVLTNPPRKWALCSLDTSIIGSLGLTSPTRIRLVLHEVAQTATAAAAAAMTIPFTIFILLLPLFGLPVGSRGFVQLLYRQVEFGLGRGIDSPRDSPDKTVQKTCTGLNDETVGAVHIL